MRLASPHPNAWLTGGPGENFLWFVAAGLSILVFVIGSVAVTVGNIAKANSLLDMYY
jgi:hypothetical protein